MEENGRRNVAVEVNGVKALTAMSQEVYAHCSTSLIVMLESGDSVRIVKGMPEDLVHKHVDGVSYISFAGFLHAQLCLVLEINYI